MSNVSAWSITAGSNNASPPNGWPEGMQRSAVNDAARENMAALARWYQDVNASLVTTGGPTAYVLTTNNGHAALASIPMTVFRVNIANTGACTIAVDGLTAKSLVKAGGTALSSGDLAANQLVVMIYNPNQDRFELVGIPPTSVSVFPTGTLMLFQQTAAPATWTKQTTHNDKALRIVSGTASSGGSTAFSSVLASRTIAVGNLPSHSHNAGTLAVGTTISGGTSVTRGWSVGGGDARASGGSGQYVQENDFSFSNDTISLASGALTGASATAGSGTAMDFAIQYVDVIIASKDA